MNPVLPKTPAECAALEREIAEAARLVSAGAITRTAPQPRQKPGAMAAALARFTKLRNR